MINQLKNALEFRKALELFVMSFDPDIEIEKEKILAVPSVFPKYKVGNSYKTKDLFRYGNNKNGDPQIYQVLQDHTSSAEWTPDTATSLYKPIGINSNGIPEWVQPLGATDAYNEGDEVMYKGVHYKSIINNNVWAPDTYPQGWETIS